MFSRSLVNLRLLSSEGRVSSKIDTTLLYFGMKRYHPAMLNSFAMSNSVPACSSRSGFGYSAASAVETAVSPCQNLIPDARALCRTAYKTQKLHRLSGNLLASTWRPICAQVECCKI